MRAPPSRRPHLRNRRAIHSVLAAASVLFALAPALGAESQSLEVTSWQSGLVDLTGAWQEHPGDNPAWSSPGFDSSSWRTVDLDDIGPARTSWRWFRKRIAFAPKPTGGSDADSASTPANLSLLIESGRGTYELYVNGAPVSGANIDSAFEVYRPTERVFPLPATGDLTIAIRTHAPPGYAAYHLPLFLSIAAGDSAAIEYERQSLESQRLYSALPSIFINGLLVLAGIAAFALYLSQRAHREYLFLGLYLALIGLSNGTWIPQQAGVVPISANFLFADPLTYLFNIAQIEFTFSFTGHKVGRVGRAYEALLLAPIALIVLCWLGLFSSNAYVLIEAIVIAPVAVSLPILLWRWYRGGNREAAWLILPSLLPAAFGTLYELGTASLYLGWRRLDFLDNSIPVGPISLAPCDLCSLLFLMAIGVVIFHRFTRVSREQARSAAELDAAREIQQQLVPAEPAPVAGYQIEAAYLPAQEVGGDFYQVLAQPNGGTLIAVGDVSGKGLKAAMTGALTIGSLRTLAAQGLGPAELLMRLNRQIASNEHEGFVTCLALHVADGGTVMLANAGHLAPYLDGKELAMDNGLPLGVVADAEYSQTSVRLAPDDTLTLLSDGVAEARNARGELFGFERTAACSTQTAETIAQAAKTFGQEDDITVLRLTRQAARK